MVLSFDAPYSPLQRTMMGDDGTQSGEDSSDIHSPIFDPQFSSTESFRYPEHQNRTQNTPSILNSQFPLTLDLQRPLIEGPSLEDPSPHSAHSFSSDFSFSTSHHSHSSATFPSLDSRVPRITTNLSARGHAASSGNFSYNPPSGGRRLPSGPMSYDQADPRSNDGFTSVMTNNADQSEVQPEHTDSHSEIPPSPAQSKHVSTVVIACRQCRSRKIRCDSSRPVCNNCVRRSNKCEYDTVPKRRGPDKRPGTRQRSCKKRPPPEPIDTSANPSAPKRRRTRTSSMAEDSPFQVKENMGDFKKQMQSPQEIQIPSQIGEAYTPSPTDMRINSPHQLFLAKNEQYPVTPNHPYAKPSFARQLDVNILPLPPDSGYRNQFVEHPPHNKFPVPNSTVTENHKEWWESFTRSYPLQTIIDDVDYLFSDTSYLLGFLHTTSFFNLLCGPEQYTIQPAFILATLALSTLMKSSELEYGAQGRERASWLRDSAQASLDAAWDADFVDARLAEAAAIIVLYEMSAHPRHSPERIEDALRSLDNIFQKISITSVDSTDFNVSRFAARSVPVVNIPYYPEEDIIPGGRKCHCPPAASSPGLLASWSYYSLPWDAKWSDLEIQGEECRRLCWCALGLIATYTAQCAAFDRDAITLWIGDPSNYAVLFPGEISERNSSVTRVPGWKMSYKESIWALYCRSMLLFVFCNTFSRDKTGTYNAEDKTELTAEAWSESQAIQDALDMHICHSDTAILYVTKEYIVNIRMTLALTFRGLNGLNPKRRVINRKQAEEWVLYQGQVIKRVTATLQRTPEGPRHPFTRRPYQAAWFLNQLTMCMLIWTNDRTIIGALNLAKCLLFPVDVMSALWDCPMHQQQVAKIRERLTEECAVVGIDPPLSSTYSLPTNTMSA